MQYVCGGFWDSCSRSNNHGVKDIYCRFADLKLFKEAQMKQLER